MRKSPPPSRIRSRPEKSWWAIVNQGSVRLAIQLIERSNRIRMIIASDRPTRRARSRSSRGNRSARIEIKITLSMPRTISSTVKVSNAAQISPLEIQSTHHLLGHAELLGRLRDLPTVGTNSCANASRVQRPPSAVVPDLPTAVQCSGGGHPYA